MKGTVRLSIIAAILSFVFSVNAEPEVRVKDIAVAEGVSKEAIHRVVRQHLNELNFCYDQQLKRNVPSNLHGEIQVQFAIAPTGSVQSAWITEAGVFDVAMEECFTRAIRRWIFPSPEAGGIVSVKGSFLLTNSASAQITCPVQSLPYNYMTDHGFMVRVESDAVAKIYDIRTHQEKFLYALSLQNDADAFYIDQTGRIAVALESGTQQMPKSDSVGAEFFIDGKLVKSYRVFDLVKDLSKFYRWNCRYVWIDNQGANPMGLSFDGEQMSVVTVDNIHYVFSTRDGKIVKQGIDHIPIDLAHQGMAY